jgi:hypothetical protein
MEGNAMRNRLRLVVPLVFVSGLLLVQAPVASDRDGPTTPGLVDFRMAPLEQVKKINSQLRDRAGASETLTIMTWDGVGDANHLILNGETPRPTRIRALTTRRDFDSVSWGHRSRRPLGSCDSQAECERKTEEMCKAAGHNGVNKGTVSIVTHADGSKTCSGDCNANGAVAFVTCNPS